MCLLLWARRLKQRKLDLIYIRYSLDSHEVKCVGLNMAMTRVSTGLLITSTFLCGTHYFVARTLLSQINYDILVPTTLNSKESTGKKKWAETGITTSRRMLNVRASQVLLSVVNLR